jgi:hypothetical protein
MVALPSWLIVLIIGNLTGLVSNMIVVVWWASRINAWLTDVREELKEKVRPKLHQHDTDITGHHFAIDDFTRRIAALEQWRETP